MAFALPALVSTVPQSAPALASGPIVARQNPLLGELDTVVAGATATSVLLAAVTPKGTVKTGTPISTTCQTATKVRNLKVSSPPPTGIRLPTPTPVKKSNPATHKP